MIGLDTAYFIVACLLVLSIVTISLCKKDKQVTSSYAEFLFAGKSFLYSVVSSAGAVFSVTYLLGATFIYATIYRGWTLLIAIAGTLGSFFSVRRVIHIAARDFPGDPSLSGQHNILLRLMQRRLNEANFRTFLRLLALAFFLLLVEELAISRVVLSSVMQGLEPVSAILLFIIVAVVFSYVYIGGFRAVLNADLIQGAVLAAFLAVLVYFVGRRGANLTKLARSPDAKLLDLTAAAVLWTAYGVAFLTMAVDLFSRLNFVAPARLLTIMRVRFVGISMFLVFFVLTAGIAFGLAISSEINAALRSASEYYATVVNFFSTANSGAVRVIFVVGLFCMIFTTVNTLLLTTMQIRFYSEGLGKQRGDLSKILVLAVGASVLVEADWVCVFGILVGAILLLPCMQLFGQLFPRIPFTPPTSHRYLWVALALATLTVVTFRNVFLEDFAIHYAMPGFFLISTMTCGLVAAIMERLSRRSSP
jgi:hypothetical protein